MLNSRGSHESSNLEKPFDLSYLSLLMICYIKYFINLNIHATQKFNKKILINFLKLLFLIKIFNSRLLN